VLAHLARVLRVEEECVLILAAPVNPAPAPVPSTARVRVMVSGTAPRVVSEVRLTGPRVIADGVMLAERHEGGWSYDGRVVRSLRFEPIAA
jgi:hypothetical protein